MTVGRAIKSAVVTAGLNGLGATHVYRLAGDRLRGLGAVLMFHRVRPEGTKLKLNRGLSVTPDFLRRVIEALRAWRYDIVSLDDAIATLRRGGGPRPFAVLTFDDGYLDNLIHAEPVLRALAAPYTVYVAPGLTDGSIRAWWEDLETAAERLPVLAGRLCGDPFDLPARSLREKNASAEKLAARLRLAPDADARAVAMALREASWLSAAQGPRLFMDWDELRSLAASPLCTIGAHTMNHVRLAGLAAAAAHTEMAESQTRIEREIGRPVRHFAYPYGWAQAAGPREFTMAKDLGFFSAVTTRPGLLYPQHADHLTALPRLSVHGEWQDARALEALLSGLPFAAWNRGRRLDVA